MTLDSRQEIILRQNKIKMTPVSSERHVCTDCAVFVLTVDLNEPQLSGQHWNRQASVTFCLTQLHKVQALEKMVPIFIIIILLNLHHIVWLTRSKLHVRWANDRFILKLNIRSVVKWYIISYLLYIGVGNRQGGGA